MDVLVGAGAKPQRVIMGHLDFFGDFAPLKSLAETGCFLEIDSFGLEDTSLDLQAHPAMHIPTDVQRIEKVEYLMKLGCQDRILISHDVGGKFRYVRYGGKCYDHILGNIAPRMRGRGFTEAHIRAILVDNPRRIFTVE